ncbi:hypothetical protein SH580_15455 [Coraliomargarita algicola]|uniref:HTH gntR-type domain-containing protein n=1 Tax=Coraliomargarita algicola TaxID=3092156 RepID=A0ABZ0RIB9_9BACT|nr:hypothetical protein [Coraliomargarita sp. J2-16]WPJ94828.1 hypothetical protein SH580_15455 [Coraliomargarita sp. J2-16]
MSTKQKDRVFFEVLAKLNRYIEANIKTEGFLPSESKMCELFEVSRVTYRSAVAAFRTNGFIVSYPKKGHYVLPRQYWAKKVGVVLGHGKESPFIQLGEILGSLINNLECDGINVQIIQSSLPENLRWRAMAHGVRALAWVYPSDEVRSVIQQASGPLPYSELLIDTQYLSSAIGIEQPTPVIAIDGDDYNSRKIHFIHARGHRKVAFISSTQAESQRLSRIIGKLALEFEGMHIFLQQSDSLLEIIKLAQRQAVTAIVATGNLHEQEQLIRSLNALDVAGSLEVFLPNEHILKYFQQQYPSLGISGYSFIDWKQFGETAAEALSANILSGKPIQSRLVRSYHDCILD